MKKKLLVFDIDGTLLSESTHIIPPPCLDALSKAKENGHYIFINTGRTKACFDPSIKQIPYDGIIGGCGTYLEINNKEIFNNTLSSKDIDSIITISKKYPVDLVIEGPNTIYFSPELKSSFFQEIKNRYLKQNLNTNTTNQEDILGNKFCTYFLDKSFLRNYMNDLKQFDHIIRSDDFLEIVPRGYSKATGISELCSYLNIDNEDVYVFGDSYNDLSMLQAFNKSIVMGNAPYDLKELAYYVTTDLHDDGIYNALQFLKLI